MTRSEILKQAKARFGKGAVLEMDRSALVGDDLAMARAAFGEKRNIVKAMLPGTPGRGALIREMESLQMQTIRRRCTIAVRHMDFPLGTATFVKGVGDTWEEAWQNATSR